MLQLKGYLSGRFNTTWWFKVYSEDNRAVSDSPCFPGRCANGKVSLSGLATSLPCQVLLADSEGKGRERERRKG